MKKLLLGMLLLVSAALSAQTMSGNWMVGGDAGFNSSTPKVELNGVSATGDAVSTITIDPNIGYFIADNLAVGVNLSYKSVTKNGSDLGVGPFVRYYFVNLGESAKLFAHARFDFGSHSPDTGSSVSSTEWGIGVGLAWFLNKNVALEGKVEYANHAVAEQTDPQSGFKLKASNTDISFKIGFQIHLGGE